MKKIKLAATLILCAVALLLLLPGTAKAAESGTCGENVTWTLDDAGTLTISGTGPMDDCLLVEAPWYQVRNTIKHIVIEDGVTYVGSWSMINMRSLETVSIGKDVTEIGEFAFSCCELSTVSLPENLEVIGENAFEWCDKLEQIIIPDSVTTVEMGAFTGCRSLKEVTFGSGVTSIGGFAFEHCEKLEQITLPDGITTIGMGTFNYCTALKKITIGSAVASIGDFAFGECSVSDIYYRGTEETWKTVQIGTENEGLLGATVHFAKDLSGDLNGDSSVTTDDAVYLLLSVMFGETDYPVPAGTNLDFNSDGKTDTDDAVYLLLNVMFGAEDYPLAV